MLRNSVAALLLLATAHLEASDLRLGPEIALSQRTDMRHHDPAIAAANGIFAAWIEDVFPPIIVTALDGDLTSDIQRVHSGTAPATARGNDTLLLVWASDTGAVLARRYSLSGEPLDVEPLVIAEKTVGYDDGPEVSVASNGATYLIVWTDSALRGRRLWESGALAGAPFVIIPDEPYSEYFKHPSIVAIGDKFVVVASGVTGFRVYPGPLLPTTRIWINDVSGDGIASLPSAPLVASAPSQAVNATSVAVTSDGADAAIVWTDYRDITLDRWSLWAATPCISGLLLAGSPRQLRCLSLSRLPEAGGAPVTVDIAWTGYEYVLVWTDGPAALAQRFDNDLNAIDPEPIEVARYPTASRVRIIRSAAGATIVYSRMDGANERIFARVLQTPVFPPRRRGVRH